MLQTGLEANSIDDNSGESYVVRCKTYGRNSSQ